LGLKLVPLAAVPLPLLLLPLHVAAWQEWLPQLLRRLDAAPVEPLPLLQEMGLEGQRLLGQVRTPHAAWIA